MQQNQKIRWIALITGTIWQYKRPNQKPYSPHLTTVQGQKMKFPQSGHIKVYEEQQKMNYVYAGEPNEVCWVREINAESGGEGRTWTGLQKQLSWSWSSKNDSIPPPLTLLNDLNYSRPERQTEWTAGTLGYTLWTWEKEDHCSWAEGWSQTEMAADPGRS